MNHKLEAAHGTEMLLRPGMDHRRCPPAVTKSPPPHKKRKVAHEQQAANHAGTTGCSQQDSQVRGSTESASKWFESSNNNVEVGRRSLSRTSNEQPFYLVANPSLSNNIAPSRSEVIYGADHSEMDDSEKNDLRGVVDDLTIENRRLKKLLKSERAKPSLAANDIDRLFEVRVYGLSTGKKPQLEQLLRNFASTATSTITAKSPSSHRPSATLASGQGSSGGQVCSGGLGISKPLHTDSGYGSTFNSGATSAAATSGGKEPHLVSKNSRNKDIKNYLHDIPDNLLPQQTQSMTEQAKMSLVVRRLEQLFTGKQAAPGRHSQPVRQQEVSHSAARANASSSDQRRKVQGTREACMLLQATKVNLDVMALEPSPLQKTDSGSSSTDQRPTRPIDLDIHRAQVAVDNIEYLRHLGLSSYQMHGGDEKGEHSWIYLNLLINMAQLHTFNVTPAFIRRGVKSMSKKLELSPDGNSVRWKGGAEVTAFPHEDEAVLEASTRVLPDPAGEIGRSNSRRSKTSSCLQNMLSEEPSSEQTSSHGTGNSKHVSTGATSSMQTSLLHHRSSSTFGYQPLFFLGSESTSEDFYTDISPDSNGLARALNTSTLHRRSSGEGMITFFNNPFFYSDATADKSPLNRKPVRQALPWKTLGIEHEPVSESPLRHHDACYFTPRIAATPYVGRDDEPLLAFPHTVLNTAGEDETMPLDLPVSGIGGVYPEDNFAIDVKVGRQMHAEKSPSDQRPLTDRRMRKRYSYQNLRTEILSLQPSKLPPPSYSFLCSSSRSTSMSASSSESNLEDDDARTVADARHCWSATDSSDEQESSIDMLFMARAADPDRVAAAERAFLITKAGTGQGDGSSVATMGPSQTSSFASDARSDEDVNGSDSDLDGD